MNTLKKSELAMIRAALYSQREIYRLQERIALAEKNDKSKRDAARYSKLMSFSLSLDDKLSDMENATE